MALAYIFISGSQKLSWKGLFTMAEEKQFKSDIAVEMSHICKYFPGIKANDDISLQLKRGEIHALLGENGAGKSTLMSVLFGLYIPDSGTISIDGRQVQIKDPNDANRYGIGMVHQHFMLVDCFTGLENIILGAEPADAFGVIHPKKVRKEIEGLCQKYNFKVDLDEKVGDMSVGMQQKVEILKMLFRKNDILIFDEPTAVLTPQEIEELMTSMKNLVKEGKSILFISHKLNEIMEVADRVTVLRKGRYVGTVDVKDTNVQALSNMMVGRPVQLVVHKGEPKIGKPLLSVRHLSMYSHFKHKMVVDDVSFDARAGEITCIAGIEGNGQTELIYGITGLTPLSRGHVYLRNADLSKLEPKRHPAGSSKQFGTIEIDKMPIRKRNLAGMSHIPEDRHKYGLVLDLPLKYNMVLERYCYRPFSKLGWTDFKAIKDYAETVTAKFDVRSGQGVESLTRSMSGGNQQKAIVGREMDLNKPLLIACQPTRGLDVGAIEFIHDEIVKHRDAGQAVLLVSLELDEVMNLADRILVMYEGKIVADVNPKETTYEELGLYMSGAKKMEIASLSDIDPHTDSGLGEEVAVSKKKKDDDQVMLFTRPDQKKEAVKDEKPDIKEEAKGEAKAEEAAGETAEKPSAEVKEESKTEETPALEEVKPEENASSEAKPEETEIKEEKPEEGGEGEIKEEKPAEEHAPEAAEEENIEEKAEDKPEEEVGEAQIHEANDNEVKPEEAEPAGNTASGEEVKPEETQAEDKPSEEVKEAEEPAETEKAGEEPAAVEESAGEEPSKEEAQPEAENVSDGEKPQEETVPSEEKTEETGEKTETESVSSEEKKPEEINKEDNALENKDEETSAPEETKAEEPAQNENNQEIKPEEEPIKEEAKPEEKNEDNPEETKTEEAKEEVKPEDAKKAPEEEKPQEESQPEAEKEKLEADNEAPAEEEEKPLTIGELMALKGSKKEKPAKKEKEEKPKKVLSDEEREELNQKRRSNLRQFKKSDKKEGE